MTKVNTVFGPVPVSELGQTLMHEHVFLAYPGCELDARANCERDLARISTELSDLREHGMKTIVDPTVADLGRNLGFMVEVAKLSGINIVACTGLLREEHFQHYFPRLLEIDEIADWMVSELTEGMAGTDIKAGAIKVGTLTDRIGNFEEKALRAAARAHKRTGAPIITHTTDGIMGIEQVDIFESEGADLSRIIIGHCDSNSDLHYHFDILERGAIVGVDRIGHPLLKPVIFGTKHTKESVSVGMDRIGHPLFLPESIRRGIALSIIAAGYTSQLALSQDIVGVRYGQGTPVPPRPPERVYTYLLTNFIPKLRETGLDERYIETILRELPRKFFGD